MRNYRPDLDHRATGQRGFGYAVMLDCADQQAATATGHCALNRQGIGFCAATGKNHGRGGHTDQGRHSLTRRLDHGPRRPARAMHRGRVANQAQGRNRSLTRLRPYRGGGIIIKIDARHSQVPYAARAVCMDNRPLTTSSRLTPAR